MTIHLNLIFSRRDVAGWPRSCGGLSGDSPVLLELQHTPEPVAGMRQGGYFGKNVSGKNGEKEKKLGYLAISISTPTCFIHNYLILLTNYSPL